MIDIPKDFPLNYLFRVNDSGHQMYVKCQWKGLSGVIYSKGELNDYWKMGCFKDNCKVVSVLTICQLIDALKNGWIIGKLQPGHNATHRSEDPGNAKQGK